MDKLFDYDEMSEERKVKFTVTRIKGHPSLWWNVVQTERRNQGKVPIKNWDRMVEKLRGKFLPKDFHISLFKQMQNLKQKTMIVREYTEEFYKINLRAGYIEDIVEKVAKYLNGLRYDIQDELNLVNPTWIDEAYQYALREKERIQRRQSTRGRFGTRSRGGQFGGRSKAINQREGSRSFT